MNEQRENDLLEQTSSTQAAVRKRIISALETVTNWRRFIFSATMCCTLLALLVAFLIPPKYKATASVFPAEKADLFSAFGALEGVSSLMKSFSPARGLAGLGRDPELDRYLAILKSGRVLGEVIDTFDLIKVYDITKYPRDNATKELLSNVEFSIESEGDLTIEVYDEDPVRAAAMANFFVSALNRTNAQIQSQNARSNRAFIEGRYQKNLRDLASAEDSLKAFQKRHGIIALPDQTEASIKAGAELTAQKALKEVQLSIGRRTFSSDHPQVKALELEIQELTKRISQMSGGGSTKSGEMQIFVPFNQMPDLGTDYIRRFRDVEIQYKILQFITPLYEQAKVEEHRETPSVVVLDQAYPPERKAKPKRTLIVLAGFLIGLAGSLLYALTIDRLDVMRQIHPEMHASLSNLLGSIRRDLSSFRSGNHR